MLPHLPGPFGAHWHRDADRLYVRACLKGCTTWGAHIGNLLAHDVSSRVRIQEPDFKVTCEHGHSYHSQYSHFTNALVTHHSLQWNIFFIAMAVIIGVFSKRMLPGAVPYTVSQSRMRGARQQANPGLHTSAM